MCVCVCVYTYAWCIWSSGIKASKPEVPGSILGSFCFSLVFVKNLINNISKYKNKMLLFVLYCPGPLTVMYNMYKSMTYLGVHLFPLFVLYLIYTYMRFQ